ncbi:unnamed protein product [Heterobilharzia americana]|nr:unnamed protein product [Heterobilharzia americana]
MRLTTSVQKYVRRLSSSVRSNQLDITKTSLRDVIVQRTGTQCNSFLEDRETRITKLTNGLRIASQNKLGSQCAIGVIIKAGPRYEGSFVNGTSHYLEKLGFHVSFMMISLKLFSRLRLSLIEMQFKKLWKTATPYLIVKSQETS